MNHSEIETCVIAAQKGNREELLKLLEQFKPFIFKTAKSFNIKNYDINDMEQIGYMALINAVSKYKTGSSTFSSYAFNTIKNAFRYTARQNFKYHGELSLNTPLNPNSNFITEFVDNIETTENVEEDVLRSEHIFEVRRAVSKLSQEEIDLVNMVYFNKCSLKSYAEKKGIGYLQAVRKKNKVLGKLSCYIN
jgi:RNA polymerase sporulation-specific sigma factor